MNHFWKSFVSALLVCALLISVTAFAASSTSWDKVDGDSFTVVTSKKNATVTVQVRKTKNELGMYPQDAIKVVFDPSGTAKTVTAKTGWYFFRQSNGIKTYTIKFKEAGTYTVDVDLASGMDSFLSGGCVEWRVKSTKNASVK